MAAAPTLAGHECLPTSDYLGTLAQVSATLDDVAGLLAAAESTLPAYRAQALIRIRDQTVDVSTLLEHTLDACACVRIVPT